MPRYKPSIDMLRNLKVMLQEEGIELPTNVVVGDQSISISIAKCLPDIVKKINVKLSFNISELDNMPRRLSTVADAMRAFMNVLSSVKETLKKILVLSEYDEYPDDFEMHGVARIVDMLNQYSKKLPKNLLVVGEDKFLMEEIQVLEEEAKTVGLQNFLPESAFKTLLKGKIEGISHLSLEFVNNVWNYIEEVVIKVMVSHSEKYYPQLNASMTRAAQNLIEKLKKKSLLSVQVMLEMEMMCAYTSNPEYMKTWSSLMNKNDFFMDWFREVNNISHLLQQNNKEMVEMAFDLRMRIIAYWRTVVIRLVDGAAMHILFYVQKLVEVEMDNEIVNEIVGHSGSGLEKMLEESPSVEGKRVRLQKSIELLKESKQVVARIMDHIQLD